MLKEKFNLCLNHFYFHFILIYFVFPLKRLRSYFKGHNLIIASYKIVQNEVDFFSKVKWNYIVLDEGHTIKNGKTKVSY